MFRWHKALAVGTRMFPTATIYPRERLKRSIMQAPQPRRSHRDLSSLPGILSLAAAFVALFGLANIQAAQADERDFPFTYEYLQAYREEREVAYHFLHTPRENSFEH